MAQRVLLMISNNNVALRELYDAVLRNEFPGWRVSYMTAMPERHLEIMAGYTLIVYELGRADDPRRIEAVRALGDQLRDHRDTILYTHLEGLLPDDVVADLAAHNARAGTGPVSWQGLAADLRAAAAPRDAGAPGRGAREERARAGRGLLDRVQDLFRRGHDDDRSAPRSGEPSPRDGR
jgi:hypothetical protein